MIRVKLLSVGKTKESWLLAAIQDYQKRLQPTIAFDFIWVKDDAELLAKVSKEPSYILLDSKGEMMTSDEFAKFFYLKAETEGARLCFVIGGAEGLPSSLKTKAPLISFSRLTFTHQMIRLLVVEQIYRATEIFKGSSYHK